MKKMMKKMTVLLVTFVMIISAIGPVSAFADDEPLEGEPTVAGLAIPYGVYEPTQTLLYESPRGLQITCKRVHVTNQFRAEITFSSVNYTRVIVDGVEYAPVVDTDAGTTTFIIPVVINKEMGITGTTVAMGGEPKDIDYTITVALPLDKDQLKPAAAKPLQDGFYTTTVNTNKEKYGWKISKNKVQEGFSYPSNNYELPVTIQVNDGKIVDVAYTRDPKEVMMNTSSDFNYLLWAMEGHNVTDYSYNYLDKSGGNYDTYHLDPHPNKCGTGLREQLITKNGITGVDTITAATITSRAIIDSVDQSLVKAEAGEKDDPEPDLPTPDMSEDIIPADGLYTAKATTVGFSMSADKDILLEVKDGKMTAKLMYIEQQPTSYPYIYPGNESETLTAGEDKWFVPENYDYGYRSSKGAIYYGSLYRDVPVKSLDKPNHFMMFAGGSGNWFNRLITISSEDIKAASEEEVAVLTAEADLEAALAKEGATADDINKAKQAYLDAITAQESKAASEAAAALQEAQAQIDTLTVQAKQVKGVKAKAGKKKATVSWKKLGSGYQYEVYVSTKVNSGFKKKATTSKLKVDVKKLKSKKTYYVKVCGVKTVNEKTVRTAFSDLAKVKVK